MADDARFGILPLSTTALENLAEMSTILSPQPAGSVGAQLELMAAEVLPRLSR